MPSLLVNSSMPKALRTRIETALVSDLRQRTLFPGRGRARKYIRAVLALASIALSWTLVVTYRQSRREVEQKRSATLSSYQRLAATADTATRARIASARERIAQLGAAKNGWSEVGGHAEVAALAGRPLLYLRADAHTLQRPSGSEAAARDSEVDALAACLVTPPANLRESTLLRAIGKSAPKGHVHALSEALAALDFFDSNFAEQVRSAEHMQELEHLATRLTRPTLEQAVLSLRAEVLLVVIDEPKAEGVVSDFDGEAAHAIRLAAIDLASARVIWQHRAEVDPAWISDKSRLAYSRALNGCRLAYDLRQGAAATP